MAKHKKRRKRNKNARVRLSWKDKAVYGLLLVLIIVYCFGMLVAIIEIRNAIAFADNAVLASGLTASILWAIPLWALLPMGVGLFLAVKYSDGYRFFRREERDGKVYVVSNPKKKTYPHMKIIILSVIACSVLMFPLSFFGRECLTADGITTFSIFNNEKDRYCVEDIKNIEFKTAWSRTRHTRNAQGYIIVYTSDDTRFVFEFSEFRDRDLALDTMLAYKEIMGEEKITYNIKIEPEEFIYENEFTHEQAEKVRRIFGN